MDKLKWLVAADLWETESSVFWRRPGVDPKNIDTECFLLPAASSVEKEGSISNSGRWAQWRYAANHGDENTRTDGSLPRNNAATSNDSSTPFTRRGPWCGCISAGTSITTYR